MKRSLLAAPLAALALFLSALTAVASEWCSEDPPIHFVDATGHTRTVYLTAYGEGVEHSHAVSAVSYTSAIEYGDHGHKTKVRLVVFVPDDSRHHFHVRTVVSTGPGGTGVVLARHDGDSGHGSAVDFETRN